MILIIFIILFSVYLYAQIAMFVHRIFKSKIEDHDRDEHGNIVDENDSRKSYFGACKTNSVFCSSYIWRDDDVFCFAGFWPLTLFYCIFIKKPIKLLKFLYSHLGEFIFHPFKIFPWTWQKMYDFSDWSVTKFEKLVFWFRQGRKLVKEIPHASNMPYR